MRNQLSKFSEAEGQRRTGIGSGQREDIEHEIDK
jgi:hypothetical protein